MPVGSLVSPCSPSRPGNPATRCNKGPALACESAPRRPVRSSRHPGPARPRPREPSSRRAAGDHAAALEALLEVLRRFRRKEPGEEARQLVLQLLEAVEARSELADAYRARLSRELYR